jgi:hypothetical protein
MFDMSKQHKPKQKIAPQKDPEGFNGIGKKSRRAMVKRWKEEGVPQGLSLREWARQTGIGDAADVWIRSKTGTNP